MGSSQRVVLIDGSALMFRAFYALPASLSTREGLPTNAVFGFATMFRKLIAGRRPELGAVVFDAPGPSFRERAYPQYKAQRPRMPAELRAQIPHIHRLVRAWRMPLLSVEGVEADDVIGTLCRQARQAGHEVYIISPDKDFAQLVSAQVRLVDTSREVRYDPELVRKKWGVLPEQFVDYLALLGDRSDNIPGVPGIGKKTATRLLAAHGSLESILEAAPEIGGRAGRSLVEHAEQARLSRDLATIRTELQLPVGLEELQLDLPAPSELNPLYTELEFYSLLSAPEQPREDTELPSVPDSIDAAVQALGELSPPLAVWPLIEPPGPHRGALVGLAFAAAEQRPVYLSLRAAEGPSLGSAALEAISGLLSTPDLPRIVHDAKALCIALSREGQPLAGAQLDTRIASFLADPTGALPHRLDQVVKQYLQRGLPAAADRVGRGRSRRSWTSLPAEEAAAFAAQRARAVRELAEPLARRLADEGQRVLHDTLYLPLVWTLARMERAGVCIDTAQLEQLGRELRERRDELEAEIHALAGRRFNIGSTKQLGTVLYEELELPVLKRTRTGYSTAAEVLQQLEEQHPIVPRVLAWRKQAQMIQATTDVLLAAVHPEDGRIHATWQQTAGASGRLISMEPDLQRTPVRTATGRRVRHAFVAPPGHVLLSADWSQIELRLLAHFSGDARLLSAYSEGRDVHRATAGRLFDLAPHEVSDAQRQVGKTVNFATIYGQGASALARSLDLPTEVASAYIDRFFQLYSGVRDWLDHTVSTASVLGYVETLLGRRRYIRELSSRTPSQRMYGERIATNTPIQGSAADLCMIAMLDIDGGIQRAGLNARLILQIHDELVFEVPAEQADELEVMVREAMERAAILRVPLRVQVGRGASWGEAH